MTADRLSGATEDNVLTLLAWSEEHAIPLTLRLTPELFSTRIYQNIAQTAIDYITKHAAPPRVHLRDLFEDQLRRGEDGILLKRYLDAMETLAPNLQADYVLAELDRFIAIRQLTNALNEAADALQGGDIEKAREALTEVKSVSLTQKGTWLSDTDAMLRFLEPRDDDYFSSGLDALDVRHIRPARKELFLIIGSKGIGKSWWLIQVGKHALMHRRSVLHITLELSEELTAQRYVQALYAMTTSEVKSIRVPVFKKDSLQRCISIEHEVRSPELLNSAARFEVSKRLQALGKRAKLLIKEFPAKGLSVGQLNGYLDYLERVENFRPDMVVLDQAFNMQFDGKDARLAMGQGVLGLRGLAQSRNLALVTAWQGNRMTDKARTVTTGMIAEDWSLGGTADTICTISRTPEEGDIGLARILVDKARTARDKYIVMISQSLETGQFAIDSAFMSKFMADEANRLTGTEEDE